MRIFSKIEKAASSIILGEFKLNLSKWEIEVNLSVEEDTKCRDRPKMVVKCAITKKPAAKPAEMATKIQSKA